VGRFVALDVIRHGLLAAGLLCRIRFHHPRNLHRGHVFSQNNEESYVLAACPETYGKCLEIGAWSPTVFSNSRALIEKGWSAVLVEPSPQPFAGLKAEYGEDPRITLINAAVTLDDVLTVGMFITADAVSTTDVPTYEKWKDHVKYDGSMVVPAITLEKIYEQHGEFDFVSIDAEGVSTDILHRLIAMGKRPKAICVEHDERTIEILSAVTPLGYYCVYASGENLVLVR
jgi:FkbM family methyltransferase